jgi:glutamate dehydrogenase
MRYNAKNRAITQAERIAMKDSTAVSLRIEEIIGAAAALLGGKDASALPKEAEFIRQFCLSLPQEDLFYGYAAAAWAKIALDGFAFVERREGTDPQIRIFSVPVDGKDDAGAVIEILTDDRPFLVDSVTEELARRRLEVYCISHPVISVGRDADGRLTSVHAPASPAEGERTESFQHFRICPVSSAEDKKDLESGIREIIGVVSLVVSSWQDAVAKTLSLKSRLEKCAEAYRDKVAPKDRADYDASAKENGEFLEWLTDNNFIFLGHADYRIRRDAKGMATREPVAGSESGILSPAFGSNRPGGIDLPLRPIFANGDLRALEVAKANERSLVHRPVHMDYIIVRLFDADGAVVEECRIIGMFTSVVYYQSARDVPLIRRKMKAVEERSGFLPASHNGKSLRTILEAFPRDELLQIDAGQLFEIAMGIVGLSIQPRVRLFVRKDELERYASCIVFLPRDRMSTNLRYKVEKILCDALNGTVSTHYTQISESSLARLQVIIKTTPRSMPAFDEREIERRIMDVTHDWEDNLAEALTAAYGEHDGRLLQRKYANAFPNEYAARFSVEDASADIGHIERLNDESRPAIFSFRLVSGHSDQALELKIFHAHKQISLSEIIPIVENMGLKTVDEFTYPVGKTGRAAWIHVLRFSGEAGGSVPFASVKENAEEALLRIWNKETCNDSLNALVIRAGLDWRRVLLLRAYTKYLKQARFGYSQAFICQTLSKYPNAASLLAELFHARFNPSLSGDRADAERKAAAALEEGVLAGVENLADDRVLRAFLDLIRATLRTNYFRRLPDGGAHDYVSFKMKSSEIGFLPKPRPFVEIFVYSSYMEGVHLRGGKVARGGLRWSDRHEDFRTEVLALMKAQMTKNSVIIPVGSKGGFVVKHPPKERDAFLEEGKRCYRAFLRGLLDVTDNLVGGKVAPPQDVVRHDGDDPYLVVAADKGTATFSDIANKVAAEYRFWLGDAFASGGSAGYDHKKMGITAKGAWISVQRHFRETGIDVQTQPIRVVGVGDMSGDVFGNGMLLSRKLKLVGAFDHRNIFLDPDPDPEISCRERERLFALPRSSWTDYDLARISAGGGVFRRDAASVPLSPEAGRMLGTEKEKASPDEVIRLMLRADVDLLWNGGIGTYVKASTQSNEEADDKANDAVRVNGTELRCKAVGEGGNLGFTQLGRIEYAKKGGRINTDAIDNSAGVDCSDHEVNIKIALNRATESGRLDGAVRNKLLEDMTDEVAELVLADNFLQTQALSIAELQGTHFMELYIRLIDFLETRYTLDRAIEFLPAKEEIVRRQVEKKGLTRPELSVLLAYCKLFLYESLLATDMPDDPYYESGLLGYFPERLQEGFAEEIKSHPLRREIVATVVTNNLLNRMGCAYFFRMVEITGASLEDVADAYVIVRDAFGFPALWEEIEAVGKTAGPATTASLFRATQQLMQRSVSRLLCRHERHKDVGSAVALYGDGVEALRQSLPDTLSDQGRAEFDARRQKFLDQNVPYALADKIALMESLFPALDIISVARKAGAPIKEAASVYYRIGQQLQLRWMRIFLLRDTSSYWQQVSAYGLAEEIYREQERLAGDVMEYARLGLGADAALRAWQEERKTQLQRFSRFVEDMKTQEEEVGLAVVVVALQKLRDISSNREEAEKPAGMTAKPQLKRAGA